MGACLQMFVFLQKEQRQILQERADLQKCRYLQLRLLNLMENVPLSNQSSKQGAAYFYTEEQSLFFSQKYRSNSKTNLRFPLFCKLFFKDGSLYVHSFEKDQEEVRLCEVLFEGLESYEMSFYGDSEKQDAPFLSSWQKTQKKKPEFMLFEICFKNSFGKMIHYHFVCPLNHADKNHFFGQALEHPIKSGFKRR